MEMASIRETVTDAIRYWEPRRIIYNLVLGAIVTIYFVRGMPSSKNRISFDSILILFLLAVLANIAYCAAYLADIFAQGSGFRETWQSKRWILFLIGMIFAAILTRFISMGFFLPQFQ
jgi:hypothetical protein